MRGVAIREFPLPGYGFADYLLYVDGMAVESRRSVSRSKKVSIGRMKRFQTVGFLYT